MLGTKLIELLWAKLSGLGAQVVNLVYTVHTTTFVVKFPIQIETGTDAASSFELLRPLASISSRVCLHDSGAGFGGPTWEIPLASSLNAAARQLV